MNRLLTLVLFIFLSSTGFAQLTGIIGEVVADHDTTELKGSKAGRPTGSMRILEPFG